MLAGSNRLFVELRNAVSNFYLLTFNLEHSLEIEYKFLALILAKMVVHPGAFPPGANETQFFKGCELSGNIEFRFFHPFRDFADAVLAPIGKQSQYTKAEWIAQRFQLPGKGV